MQIDLTSETPPDMNIKIKTVTKTQSEPDEPAPEQNPLSLDNQAPSLLHPIPPPVAIIPPMAQQGQQTAEAVMMYNQHQ